MTPPDLVRALLPVLHVIHLETMLKVDVFVAKGRPFDEEALRRARPLALAPGDPTEMILASAEDIVLAKLEWFRAGGERSERQWTDVLGVLQAGAPELDLPYLRRWAAALGVGDLLEKAITDATIH